jgi:hypothetical protein
MLLHVRNSISCSERIKPLQPIAEAKKSRCTAENPSVGETHAAPAAPAVTRSFAVFAICVLPMEWAFGIAKILDALWGTFFTDGLLADDKNTFRRYYGTVDLRAGKRRSAARLQGDAAPALHTSILHRAKTSVRPRVSAICRPPSKINQLLINMHRYCEGFSHTPERNGFIKKCRVMHWGSQTRQKSWRRATDVPAPNVR